MPSIRIKGQVYASLEDAISTNDNTLYLPGELPGTPNAISHTPNIRPKPSLPLLPRGVLDMTSTPSHGRPRAATTSSRIYAHCINTSRNSQLPQPWPNPLGNIWSAPTSGVGDTTISQDAMTVEGVQADIRMPPHVQPGIVESSINLSFPANGEDPRHSGFSDHHHDDVVEHLDVIGIFSPFPTSSFK